MRSPAKIAADKRRDRTKFQIIAKEGKLLGITPNVTADAREWYRNEAMKVSRVNNQIMMSKYPQQMVPKFDGQSIGQMYMFNYDPKWKEELPYYDTFPLIFPIDMKDDGFLGINLHYLPPLLRAKLMDALYETSTDERYDKSTKLKISYGILVSASKFKYFKPCIKRYLWSHCKSGFFNIDTEKWDIALMLPTARFQKATAQEVWAESAKKVSK